MWDPVTDQVRRVSKDAVMPIGARILLPKSAIGALGTSTESASMHGEQPSSPTVRQQGRTESPKREDMERSPCVQRAVDALRAAVLLDTPSFLALNKPPGLAVQGGTGVGLSLDALLPVAFPHGHADTSKSTRSAGGRHIGGLDMSSGGGGSNNIGSSGNNGDSSGGNRSRGGGSGVKRDFSGLRLVHRLDAGTSGALLVAKGADAAAWLGLAFKHGSLSTVTPPTKPDKSLGGRGRAPGGAARLREAGAEVVPRVKKVYWAVVAKQGNTAIPPKGTIDAPLHQSSPSPEALSRRKEAQPGLHHGAGHAVSHFRVLAESRSLAWLELEPVTGKKHQLRMHCAHHLGTPILGDSKYGAVRGEVQRQVLHQLRNAVRAEADSREGRATGVPWPPLMLHCRRLVVHEPGTKAMEVVAPPPVPWQGLFELQGWKLPP